jgi:Flp pilus assembly protein TadD
LVRDGLSALLVSNPRFSPALVLQAQTQLGASRPEEAIPSLTRAVDLDPGSVEARFWLSVAYYENGEVLQGNTAMADLTRLAPEYPPLRLLRIRRQLVEHRLDAVLPLLDDFLKDYPNDVEGLLLKSEWLALAGDYSGSNAILAALPPVWNQRVLAFNRARLAYLQGQYRNVVEYTEPLMGEPAASWRPAYLRAAAMARLGQYKEALALLPPYLKLAEGDGRFHRLMGDVYLMSGDRVSSERAYQEGLATFPRKPLLVDALSHLAIVNQNWSLARDQLERGLEQPGEYRTVFLERLILVYQRLNLPQEAQRVQDDYLAAADPVLQEALRPNEQGLLFSMSLPPLEPIFRAASSARVPPPPVPITRAADALSLDPGLRGLPVAPPLR